MTLNHTELMHECPQLNSDSYNASIHKTVRNLKGLNILQSWEIVEVFYFKDQLQPFQTGLSYISSFTDHFIFDMHCQKRSGSVLPTTETL